MKKKSVMILGASALQVPAIEYAKGLGYEVILIDYDPEAVGFALGDVNLLISTLDEEAVLQAALKYEPDFVMTSTSDGPVRTAAYVNEMLGKKPDLSYEDSKCATIKSFMRDRLKQCGVAIPAYFAVENETQFLEAVHRLKDEKIIVKPADNAGSRGVVLLEPWEIRKQITENIMSLHPSDEEKNANATNSGITDIQNAAHTDYENKLLETYHYSKENSRNGLVMVEEYMEGDEVSVEAMTVNGETTVVTITDKLTTKPPFFVELGHLEPSRHSEDLQEKIKALTLQAVKAIGLQNGPSHTEVKLTSSGPKIVELAARLGGDFITSKLVPLSTGVDLVGNSVLLATGQPVNLNKTLSQGAAIRFIQSRKGMIQELSAGEEVFNMPGVKEVVLYKKAGDYVQDTVSSNHRLGHVIATGRDGEEAMARATAAMEKITVVIC